VILTMLNVLACAVISLACWSFLLSSRSESRLAIAINLGLLLLAVGTFVSAFAPLVRGSDAGWWTVMARTGGATVAAVLYERRFGMRAQARALVDHVHVWMASWKQTVARLQHAWQLIRHRSRHP
jgi:hypothetical protein